MLEASGNIFDFPHKHNHTEAICVTTNGIVKKDGRAVMGAGVAKAFRDKFKNIDLRLAEHIRKNGNVTGVICSVDGYYIISFPTKNDWVNDSDIDLIKQSAILAKSLADNLKLTDIWLPRPGCANGHLQWSDVKKVIEPILDDRFTIVTL